MCGRICVLQISVFMRTRGFSVEWMKELCILHFLGPSYEKPQCENELGDFRKTGNFIEII